MVITEKDMMGFIALSDKTLKERREHVQDFTEDEKSIIETIKGTREFNLAEATDLDRHTIRYLINKYTPTSPGIALDLARKIELAIKENKMTVQLDETAGSLSKEIGGEDKPGLGAAPSTPKGDADKGVDQKSDSHGDLKQTGGKGYAAEAKKEEEPEEEPKGEEPEKEDDETMDEEFKGDDAEKKDAIGQKGAELEKGKGQNEAQEHKPVADDPGIPAVGKHNKKPETVDAKTPDYSCKQVKKQDPSKSDLNKATSPVTGESFQTIEDKLVDMLESAGFEVGSEKWTEMFTRGFQYAIAERAKEVAARLQEAEKAKTSEE